MSWVGQIGLGVIAVRGPDARAFLQGQVTCDLRRITADRALLGAVANAQGRVIALCRVVAEDDGLLLWLPVGEANLLRERLVRYVLRAKVTISVETHSMAALGATDEGAIDALEARLGNLPRRAGDVTRAHGLTAVALEHGPRVFVYGPRDSLALFSSLLPRGGASVEHWELSEIAAGLPQIGEATREAFIPQMLNLDLLDAVSFDKGCYVGQEIIARAQHLGRVKRRMLRARVSLSNVAAGAPVLVRGEVTGHIVCAARDGHGRFELLATVGISDAGAVLETGSPPAALERLPLPYAVPGLDAES